MPERNKEKQKCSVIFKNKAYQYSVLQVEMYSLHTFVGGNQKKMEHLTGKGKQ